MINQGRPKHMLLKHVKKAFNRHPEAFHKYHKYHIMASDIVSNIAVASINTRSVSGRKGN